MKWSKFTEEWIIAILREKEAGLPTADICRKLGISSAIFYAGKAKLGGIDVWAEKRLKPAQRESAQQMALSRP